jgi:hypothetical protein
MGRREATDIKNPALEMAEAPFQASVIALAKLAGWRCYHTHDSRKSPEGFPDLILVKGPLMLAVECKRDSAEATPEQRAWLEAFDAVKVVASYVWRPRDMAEITTMIGGPQ